MEVRLRIGKNVVGSIPEKHEETLPDPCRGSQKSEALPLSLPSRVRFLLFFFCFVLFFGTYLTLKFLQRQNRTLLLNMKYM